MPTNRSSWKKKFTTVNTTKGLFQFQLPFGVSALPLQDLPRTVVYIDDIVVASVDEADHLNNLDKVISRLGDAGLILRQSKCTFGVSSVKYLGHVIDAEGIQPSVEKVRAKYCVEQASPGGDGTQCTHTRRYTSSVRPAVFLTSHCIPHQELDRKGSCIVKSLSLRSEWLGHSFSRTWFSTVFQLENGTYCCGWLSTSGSSSRYPSRRTWHCFGAATWHTPRNQQDEGTCQVVHLVAWIRCSNHSQSAELSDISGKSS